VGGIFVGGRHEYIPVAFPRAVLRAETPEKIHATPLPLHRNVLCPCLPPVRSQEGEAQQQTASAPQYTPAPVIASPKGAAIQEIQRPASALLDSALKFVFSSTIR